MESKKIVFIVFLVLIIIISFMLFKNTKEEKLPALGYLCDVVKIGDYVEYNCGDWNESAAIPKEQGAFGGYTKNKSKSLSITPYLDYKNTSDGWIVFAVKDNCVALMHAGTPVAYYHKYGYSDDSVKAMNDFVKSKFINGLYASNVRVFDYDDINSILQNENLDGNVISRIVKTSSWYWIGSKFNESLVWSVNNLGIMDYRVADGSFGVRPVVELWKNVYYTSGDGTKDNPYIIGK